MRTDHLFPGGPEFNVAAAFTAGAAVQGGTDTAFSQPCFVCFRIGAVFFGKLRDPFTKDLRELLFIRKILKKTFQTRFTGRSYGYRTHDRVISATEHAGRVTLT